MKIHALCLGPQERHAIDSLIGDLPKNKELLHDLLIQHLSLKVPGEYEKFLQLKISYQKIPLINILADTIISDYTSPEYEKNTLRYLRGSIVHLAKRQLENIGVDSANKKFTAMLQKMSTYLDMELYLYQDTLHIFYIAIKNRWES